MGIKNFNKYIKKFSPESIEKKTIHEYKNKILGVDANLILYKFLEKNITYLHNKYKNNNNNNLESLKDLENNYEKLYLQLLDTIIFAYRNKIKLIFVFDGKTPDIKKNVVNDRRVLKNNAKNELNIFNNELNELINNNVDISNNLINMNNTEINNKQKKLLLNAINLNGKIIKSVKKLLKYSGISFIDAPNEADSYLAWLSKNNHIDGIVSSDYDILTFGGKNIILDIFDNFKYNKPLTIQEINLNTLLKNIGLDYDTFIEFCILMGTDYSDKSNQSFEYIYLSILLNPQFYKNEKILAENTDMEKIKNYFKNPITEDIKNFNINDFNNEINYDKMQTFLEKKKKIIINDIIIKNFKYNIERFNK